MLLIASYVAFMIAGDLSDYLIGLIVERGKERFRARVRFLQQYYEETGARIGELAPSKRDELLKPYKDPWYEHSLQDPIIVNIFVASVFILTNV